ncbi:TetR/AcrR family transcriptional regulator [Nocardia sp. NBC_01009]|uniref:TetR/AcrR family transcriptional regulator n=1 Tax=Nocardia sp. NBC_01009 TaxID=2975996 RepID=UPI00386337B1|nr:TetR/AcrR family transcriptional regulator [Nocardia sp. NBC_01009]
MPSPTAVELLWGTQQRPKRGPKPSLSLNGIVAEAIALADADGLANLSMQRLAERLGYTKMSLYRYVPGKAELTALMLDAALGTPPDMAAIQADSVEQRWRIGLRRWTETIFEKYNAHPWSLELSVGVRPFGPNELLWMEAALQVLAGTGLTGAERLDTMVLLNGHVRSLAQQSMTVGTEGLEQQLMRELGEVMAAAGDRYPETVAAFAEQAVVGASEPGAGRDNALNFGIDRILDGLAVFIADRR